MKGHVGELNKHSKQFGGSKTEGGQVRIHHTVEGDRRNGVNDSRGYKSPLGNTDEGYSTDNQIVQEARNRAQTPISKSGVLDRFHNGGKGPI